MTYHVIIASRTGECEYYIRKSLLCAFPAYFLVDTKFFDKDSSRDLSEKRSLSAHSPGETDLKNNRDDNGTAVDTKDQLGLDSGIAFGKPPSCGSLHLSESGTKEDKTIAAEKYPESDLENGIVGWESQDDPLNPR